MAGVRNSRLSAYKQGRLVEHFVAGTTARTAAALCGVNRKTAAFYCLRFGAIIALELEAESDALLDGEIEVDESYFGGARKGRRGRGGKDTGIRSVEAWREGLYEDHTGCVIGHSVSHHGPQDRSRHPRLYRWLARLQRAGRLGLPPLAYQSFGAVRRQEKSRQRDREFLEPGEAPYAQIQRCSQGPIRAISEGM